MQKRLLLVEDDPKSLYAFNAVLEARGYEVVACATAEDAMDYPADGFDAAVIDVRLPAMQGTHLAKRLKQLHPALRIIFITAFDAMPEGKIPDTTVLLKPFGLESLLKLLEE